MNQPIFFYQSPNDYYLHIKENNMYIHIDDIKSIKIKFNIPQNIITKVKLNRKGCVKTDKLEYNYNPYYGYAILIPKNTPIIIPNKKQIIYSFNVYKYATYSSCSLKIHTHIYELEEILNIMKKWNKDLFMLPNDNTIYDKSKKPILIVQLKNNQYNKVIVDWNNVKEYQKFIENNKIGTY